MEVKVELVSNRPARKVGRERARPVPDVPLRGNAPTILNTQPVRNIWRGRDHWPTFIPSGYLYVPDVFEKIGEAIHGEGWTGEEGAFRKNVEAFPRPSVVFEGDTDIVVDGEKYREGRASVAIMLGIDQSRRALPFTNKEWCDATDVWMHFDVYGPALLRRRAAVIQHIHRRAEAGELVFYIRHEGEMLPVSRKAWNFEAARIEQRIETGLMNDVPLEFLGLLHGGKTMPFFARKAELMALLGGAQERMISTGPSGEAVPIVRGVLDSGASASERLHEVPAHNAAAIIRETGCSVAAAIRQVRDQVEANNRTSDSIDRAIRESFNRMYSKHGKPKL